MNLENIIENELKKREEIEQGNRDIYLNYVKDYIIDNKENNSTSLDFEKLKNDGKEAEYNRIVYYSNESIIKLQILRDFVENNSGLEYSSTNIRNTSDIINYCNGIYNSKYGVFCDAFPKDANDNREWAVYFGKLIDVTNLKNLSADEQVRTFTNYILKTINDMGYTNDDLYEACHNIGIKEFGGIDKEHSRSL